MWLQRVGHNLATKQQQWQILNKVSVKNLDGIKEAERGHLVLPRWEIRRKEQVCVHKPQILWWTPEGHLPGSLRPGERVLQVTLVPAAGLQHLGWEGMVLCRTGE